MSERPDPSGRLVESHQGFNPRVVFFHFLIAGLLAILACGLVYRQVLQTTLFHERERQQNQRRILLPGPRGNIYDRSGTLLVGNRPRFAVVLFLDELQQEFDWEFKRIRKNYREMGDKDLPTYGQMEQIARVSVAQKYLDQVNAVLGRHELIDADALRNHFDHQLLLPYTLIGDLSPEEFARLIEGIPPTSPLQIYTTNARYYPYGSAASHVLGYVGTDDNVEAEDFPGGDLTTFKMKGAIGRDGLEKRFDSQLQGQAGGTIFRVDPSGYMINPPLEVLRPRQGRSLMTSLDLPLQQIAEQAIGDRTGAAVAIDVATGEVLVLASKPDYDLNEFSPRLSQDAAADITKRGAWLDLATSGLFPPGSTFKTLVTVAGLRRGTLSPTDTSVDCDGYIKIGNRLYSCDNGNGHHGQLDLRDAIAQSCDIYFFEHGIAIGADAISEEARRFKLDRPTGIELPAEARKMNIPDAAWKERTSHEPWTKGDTANMSIGQGGLIVTPLQMACYAASLARGEIWTQPTLLHDAARATQHTEPIGLTPEQRQVLLDGMEGCTTDPHGTASVLTTVENLRIPGVRIAGKTGTAQLPGSRSQRLDAAWFICFAPLEHPRIAIAVCLVGDIPGESYGGGLNAAPVAAMILKQYFQGSQGVSPVAAAR